MAFDQQFDALAIGDVVYTWLEGQTLDLPLLFEELPDYDCYSFQTLTGPPEVTHYKCGDYIASYRFALYLRSGSVDTDSRMSAYRRLVKLAHSIKGFDASLPEGYKLREMMLENLPARVEADTDYDIWQVTFNLTYKCKKMKG